MDIKRRFSRYKSLSCKAQKGIYNSLVKYGVDNHKFEIISECSFEELDNLEIYYISLYNSFNSNFGLNLKSGGVGGKLSDKAKEKIRQSNIGRKASDEVKLKISIANKGRKPYIMTDEIRHKMSLSKIGTKKSAEQRQKISNSNKGRVVSDITKQRLSSSLKGRKSPMKGKKFTQEHKDKIRISCIKSKNKCS